MPERKPTRTADLDYFYGQSSELFSFYRIPKLLFQDSCFQPLSTDAKTLYGILLDRMSLSARNGWLDKAGRVFIIYKQLAKVKPEKRELFEQRHSRELILYDAAARYLKELKASGEEITPKEWRREIDLLAAQKQVDSIDMKAMREELKAVERLRKTAEQLARQERDKPRDRGPER